MTDEIINNMKEIQHKLIKYIDQQDNTEENYQNLINVLNDQDIQNKKNRLKILLHLISSIADNHYRSNNFFQKLEKIILHYKNSIITYFSNSSIFNIFINNKRILLFLFKEKLLTMDLSIANIFTSKKYIKMGYPEYFLPELIQFLSTEQIEKINIQIDENFEHNRQIGENNDYISELIRKDSIDEFITYVKKNDVSLKKYIYLSFFDTNHFFDKKVTLISYAAFYGSVQIFKYLYKNNVKLESSLWLNAIHSDNPELIHILEENGIKMPTEILENDDFNEYYSEDEIEFGYKYNNKCIEESIKCHHNDITNYLYDRITKKTDDLSLLGIKYYNFDFIQNNQMNNAAFFKLCQFDYTELVEVLLSEKVIDINYLNKTN